MSTILVTGASGMIGKIVVASLLSKKHKVVGTDSKPSDLEGVDPNFIFTQTDITNKAALQQMFAENGIDVLVHLANTADNDLGAFISDKEMKQILDKVAEVGELPFRTTIVRKRMAENKCKYCFT